MNQLAIEVNIDNSVVPDSLKEEKRKAAEAVYQEGVAARLAGLDRNNCPYRCDKPGTGQLWRRETWFEGFLNTPLTEKFWQY